MISLVWHSVAITQMFAPGDTIEIKHESEKILIYRYLRK